MLGKIANPTKRHEQWQGQVDSCPVGVPAKYVKLVKDIDARFEYRLDCVFALGDILGITIQLLMYIKPHLSPWRDFAELFCGVQALTRAMKAR
eukprot:8400704-Karenia_brevis.AAC.1